MADELEAFNEEEWRL